MPFLRSIAVPAIAILVAAAAAFAVTSGVRADPSPLPAGSATPVSPEIEAGYGLRLQRATMAVQGGLVDVRFTILDTVRAEPVIGHLSRERVKLVDEATGRVLDTRTMTPGDSNLKAGEGYYMLFRNSGGLLHRGSRVAIAVGKLRLDGVTVR
jgi:hypothetical protein